MNNFYLFAERNRGPALLIGGEVGINNSNNKYAFAFYSFFRLEAAKI